MRGLVEELLLAPRSRARAVRLSTPIRGLSSVVTHNTGDVLPASDWNTYLRDNLNYLILAGSDLASAATINPTNEYHNVTGTTTIQNITATTTPIKGQELLLRIVSGLTIQHNAGGTGNVFLSGAVDAALPANSFIGLVWDDASSVWRESVRGGAGAGSATTATTVAGLGSGSPGKLGRIRVMPTTYNNGGSTALPAATITVGTTAGFATAGTLTTPNGTITYTGKTATTFTGCTGGTGTLAANAVITQATVTSGSADYELVDVIYDAVLGKWVSDPLSFQNNASPSSGSSNFQWTPSASAWVAVGAATSGRAIPLCSRWRWYDAAGLKPQVRIQSGLVIATTAAANGQLRVHWYSQGYQDGVTLTDVGADANSAGVTIASVPVAAANASTPLADTTWSDIPAFTLKDSLFAMADFFCTAIGAGSVLAENPTALLRWVG